MNIHDCYDLLGLDRDASIDDIRKAYKAMVKSWHPDQFSDNPELKQKADEKLKTINIAYSTLKSFIKTKQADTSRLQNRTEFQSGLAPFHGNEPDGHFIKRIFSVFSNLLDRIFDPVQIEKQVRQTSEAVKTDQRKSCQQACRRNPEGRFDNRQFSRILHDKLHTGDGIGSDQGRPGNRSAGMLKRTHRLAQHRVGDSGIVSRISPVSRIRGIGRNR